MAEQVIQVPPDAGGKKVRTQEVVSGGNVVEMETVVLGDPTNVSNLALVSATGALKVDNSAVTQPVSGTFFQAIQPVSGTISVTGFANPLPVTLASTTITNTVAENLAQLGGAAVSLGSKTSANSIPVVLASDEAALPVTGTFFQATQPISGTVGVNNFPATQPVSGTVAVSNFPASQPVSAITLPLPSNAAQETGGNLAVLTSLTRNDPQVLDVLNEILCQLKLLNINLASNMTTAEIDGDTFAIDNLPSYN